ncbi:ABC transporter ATP-binding protein, partial [Halorubrum sp. SP9]
IARALLTDPDIVLLDEPLAGVNPTLEQKILSRIEDLVEDGYSFLLIEHDIDLIMDNCERVVVMHQGGVLTTGSPDDVKSDERVIEAYLGGDDV